MFAERIKDLRKKNKYTQSSLANKLGVSTGTVAMWETGKRKPNFDALSDMSELFDVRIDYILGNSNDDTSIKKYPDDLQQLGAWAVEDDLNETIKTFLALDSYGQSVVEKVIKSEYVRCREQKTVVDTSNITVGIHTLK